MADSGPRRVKAAAAETFRPPGPAHGPSAPRNRRRAPRCNSFVGRQLRLVWVPWGPFGAGALGVSWAVFLRVAARLAAGGARPADS